MNEKLIEPSLGWFA